LDIGDGDQKQIQRPGVAAAAEEELVANQPVIHPPHAWGDSPLPIRPEQMFANHKHDLLFSRAPGGTVLGAPAPECFDPVLSPGGRWPRCPLVTYDP